MAKSLLTVLVQTSRAIDRDIKRKNRLSSQEHAAAMRKAEQARKAEDKALLKIVKANKADLSAAKKAATSNRKLMEKEAKLAHIESKTAEVYALNSELAAIYEDIDGLLKHTLDIDDYVDLEKLRRTSDNSSFEPGILAVANMAPRLKRVPDKPEYEAPSKPKGFFGKKKQLAKATFEAEQYFKKQYETWATKKEQIEQENKQKSDLHIIRENERIKDLEKAKKQFEDDIIKSNKNLDKLINGLGYGTTDSIEEYISLVVSNSAYPEHFNVSHVFKFDPQSAELSMAVSMVLSTYQPEPSNIDQILFKLNFGHN